MILDKVNKSFGVLFLILISIEIVSSKFSNLLSLHDIAMPLLLSTLTLFFFLRKSAVSKWTGILMLIALSCALLGDLFLFKSISILFKDISILSNKSNSIGLTLHSIAHLILILIFYKKITFRKKFYLYFLLTAFIGVVFLYVYGKLASTATNTLVVSIKLIIISTIFLMSSLRKDNVPRDSYFLTLFGSCSLFISFTFLTFGKWLAFDTHDVIMLPYSLAFLCFVLGVLRQNNTYSNIS